MIIFRNEISIKMAQISSSLIKIAIRAKEHPNCIMIVVELQFGYFNLEF